MASQAQIKANRLNANKSTGPKSAEGKEKVAQNAQKHGIFSQKDVIAGENQADYDMLRMELLEELYPVGATENILAERIVSLTWRLMRTESLQNHVLDAMIEKQQYLLSSTMYLMKEESEELLIGHVVRKDFAEPRVLDKLMMYERRLENSLYRTRKELREQQKRRLAGENNSYEVIKPMDDGRWRMDEKIHNKTYEFENLPLRGTNPIFSSEGRWMRDDKTESRVSGKQGTGLSGVKLKNKANPSTSSGCIVERRENQKNAIRDTQYAACALGIRK